MPLTNFKADLTSYLKKLAGVHAVGELWWHYDPKSKPAGVQLFSGQLLSREAYTDHWTLVSTKRTVVTEEEWQAMVATQGFCQFYSSGDGSTTYRMPLVKGVHPKFVTAMDEAGQYVQAGLPNIGGTAAWSYMGYPSDGVYSGALGVDASQRYSYGATNGTSVGTYFALLFNAAASNPLYGKSDTVQPEALTMVIGEWVVGSVATLGEADAESLLASVTMMESKLGELENSGANAVPAGFVMPFAANSSPEGYLLCNGAAVSRTTYAKLFEAIGTTYGAGDGSTTFNLPDTTGRMIQGEWPYNPVGTYKNAGLPQASGSIRYLGDTVETYGIAAGGISLGGAELGAGGSIAYWQRVPLNLSNGNALYGASDTVQPPALTMRYYIKY